MRKQSVAGFAMVLLPVISQSSFADPSRPIVDVRFDAPYRQLENSSGDEWAPTWASDDSLYTANDDGSSFGGIAWNAIAFGKVEGNDPKTLKGTTVNGMAEYREAPVLGPEGAIWKASRSYRRDDRFYHFAPCARDEQSTCLMVSADAGKTWSATPTAFPAAVLGNPTFITFQFGYARNPFVGVAEGFKDSVYIAGYAGLVDGEDRYIIGRIAKDQLMRATRQDWVFSSTEDNVGGWTHNLNDAKPLINNLGLGPDLANWKAMNSYSIEGTLYLFVARCIYPWNGDDARRRHIFRDASIIKSTDNGLTWTRPIEKNFHEPMFPGKRFGAPYFVWYGKDGVANVDNADTYVYAVSNDGYFESGDNYVLGRVAREKLGKLSAGDWSFWRSGDGMSDTSWTPNLNEARPILSNPGKSSMTGVTYITHLGRYLMIHWHFKLISWQTVNEKQDFSTVLEFFEAPKPWGPWTRFKTYDTGMPGWYVPIVGQKFQRAVAADHVSALVFATGFMNGGTSDLYKLNYVPITLSTVPLPHNDSGFIGQH